GMTGWDILSVDQFGPDHLNYIFSRAEEMREMVGRVNGVDLLKGQGPTSTADHGYSGTSDPPEMACRSTQRNITRTLGDMDGCFVIVRGKPIA
ncbi:MAG: hypothetical protein J5I41_00160, partial [Saprospiraceae bacterium]|nr:hypothetical protein [Saprospiraceae bacterium]